MMTTDDHLLAGAYALGALDRPEQLAFEDHLDHCAACRTEVAELTATAALLAAAEPAPVDQPMFDRVMSQVRATPQLPPRQPGAGHLNGTGRKVGEAAVERPTGPPPGGTIVPMRPRTAMRQTRWWLRAAAVIVVAVVAGSAATRLAGERARDAELAAIIAEPAGQHLTLRGEGPGEVRVHVHAGQAALDARGMPALDPSKTYELWFMAGGTPYRAVTFEPDDSGTVRLAFTPPVAEPDAFGVTVEPVGGRDVPTPPIVLQASA
jgi:anti-sigma-K factor RskA